MIPGGPRRVRPRPRRRRRRDRFDRFCVEAFRFDAGPIERLIGTFFVVRVRGSSRRDAVRGGEHPDDGGEFGGGKAERRRGEESRGVHLRLRESLRADEVRVPGERVERVYAVQPGRRRGLAFSPRGRRAFPPRGVVAPRVVVSVSVFTFFTDGTARVVRAPHLGRRGGRVSPRGVYRQQRLRIGQHRQRGATRLFRQSRERGGGVGGRGGSRRRGRGSRRLSLRLSRRLSRRLFQARDATANRAKRLEQQTQGGVSHQTGGMLQTPGESRFRERGRDGGSHDGETLRLARGGVGGRDRRGRIMTR